MERLSTSLQNYHINALQAIAERLGLQLNETPVRKARLVGELTRLIPQISRSHTFVRALSAAEQAALAVVLSKNGAEGATLRDIAQPLMLAGLVRTSDQPGSSHLPAAQTVLTQLLHKGLLVSQTDLNGPSALRTFDYVQVVGVPPEVRSALPGELLSIPSPIAEAKRLADLPPLEGQENDLRQYMRMLFFAWAELRRQPARRLKAGGMGKRDRRRIAEALGLDPEAEADLDVVNRLYEMLEALRLVTAQDDAITAVEGDAVILFWNAKPAGQLPSLLRAYTQLASGFPIEPTTDRLSGYLEGMSLQPHQVLRSQVVDMLNQTASMGWIPTELFYQLLCGGRPGSFALGETWLGYLYKSLQWYGSTYRNELESTLQKTEWQLVQTVLNELHAFGLVALGYAATEGESQSGGPLAVRASGMMRDYVTNHTPASSSEAPWQVILQPDFQMLAMGPVPLRVLANLEQFVHREKIDESVITYRITRDEVYEGFRRGETVETILAYLTEAIDQPVPQNIIRSLEEWYGQYERIVIDRQVRIFQVDDPKLLERLLGDTILGPCLHRASDSIAWLHPDDWETVQARLMALEILPAHSQGPDADLRNSLRWHDQELEARSAVPSVYVTGSLQRIAESHNGRWRLTAESTERATTLGLDVIAIQSMLEEMTGTRLPDAWEKRLKAWGNYFGSGHVGEVRLLRLDREGALEELRKADHQLHRWLRPLPGAPDLAIVDESHWDDARALLDSWGIAVTTERWW
ncbi:MAG: helicase-associated domain-containing protein [Anaerolineae bacterium]|nr:helicase-associated domain-containing protein [Anaerolineae bacterium]